MEGSANAGVMTMTVTVNSSVQFRNVSISPASAVYDMAHAGSVHTECQMQENSFTHVYMKRR